LGWQLSARSGLSACSGCGHSTGRFSLKVAESPSRVPQLKLPVASSIKMAGPEYRTAIDKLRFEKAVLRFGDVNLVPKKQAGNS
jgi:hypothetical protein